MVEGPLVLLRLSSVSMLPGTWEMSELIGKWVGKYQIINEIAKGGMGVVYRGRQPSLNRMVAVKTLAHQLTADPNLIKRFRSEALAIKSQTYQIAGACAHPCRLGGRYCVAPDPRPAKAVGGLGKSARSGLAKSDAPAAKTFHRRAVAEVLVVGRILDYQALHHHHPHLPKAR